MPAKIFNATSRGYQFISSNKNNINQGSSVCSSPNQGVNLGPLSTSNVSSSNNNIFNQASTVSSSSNQV